MNRISARTLIAHHLLRAALLAGFALLIVYLKQRGELSLFIAPRTEQAVKLSALGMYGAAAYQAYSAFRLWRDKRLDDACDCGHDHAPSPSLVRNILLYGLFALPLLLGFLLPHAPLNSVLAGQKGVSFTGLPTPASAAPPSSDTSVLRGSGSNNGTSSLDVLFPADEYTQAYAEFAKRLYKQDRIVVDDSLYIETLTALDLYQQPFAGASVTLTGFVYRDDGMRDDQFAVSRFAMNCCSADALPYGLLVQSADANHYANDSWVTLTGTVTTTEWRGESVIMLTADVITPAAVKDRDAYVYPNYEFDLSP
ncbi:TIGR03943 family putative permease subunit [Paenibacillus kobensis]|uniref:TIGR03943 family putative permease subunit n=1 Tax=Paenibacillus kobensis TaxID=59841 RepID=UPI000FD703FA|nr:TIGR03943 family protein [Paenibacillus kobensis]